MSEEDETPPAEDETPPARSKKVSPEQIEVERDGVLASVAAAKLDTLQERVAWILNRYPDTRNSDIALQIRFWEEFEPDRGGDDYIQKSDLYTLTRLTSLARARATIQNTYRLFQASADVRRVRHTLSGEERVKAAEQQLAFPVFDVYADESGKQGKHLIVGSVWCLHPPEIIQFTKALLTWRAEHDFRDEFHFKSISDSNLPKYRAFADKLTERTSVFSFKAISVERAGVKHVDEALQELFFHLLVRGVEHEVETGRGPLPRAVQLWKDMEEPGRDKLFLASLKERIVAVSTARFDGKLGAEEFTAIDSKNKILVQVADLYTSSINRVLNAEGKRTGPKDSFADYFLGSLGLPHGPIAPERSGDMTIHVSL